MPPLRRARFGLIAAALATLVASPARAAQPVGYLDVAGCDVIGGWAQDPDEPDKAIDVHLYFNGPAGTPGAPAIGFAANVHRDDLCAAIGSCVHGFYIDSPFSFHDGQPHEVHAYGIDSQGGTNPELGNSPKVLQCAPGAPQGVRRKVDGSTSYDAWRFSSFWDLLPLGAAEADALPEGPDLPAKPELVKADDGTPEIWLLDRGVRRPLPADVIARWRFDPALVKARPAAELNALVTGTSLRPRPVIFIRGALYLLDDPQPEAPDATSASSSTASSTSATGSGGAGGGGGGGGADRDELQGTCACRLAAPQTSRVAGWLFAAAALLALSRRRAPSNP